MNGVRAACLVIEEIESDRDVNRRSSNPPGYIGKRGEDRPERSTATPPGEPP